MLLWVDVDRLEFEARMRSRDSLFSYFRDPKSSKVSSLLQNKSTIINPQAPIAQKIADEVVFRRFQGEGVEFF